MASTNQPQPQWSPEVRTWVSLALFVHLFAVCIALSSYTRPSFLQLRLHELFAPYLRNLHLTALPNSYPFARLHLTHGTTSDADFSIDVVPDVDGKPGEAVTLPPAVRPLVRLRRYQALANAAGTLASGEGDIYAGILPKAIAGSILRQNSATEGTIRIRAHGLPDIDSIPSYDNVLQAANTNVTDIFEAQVIASPTGVELLRKSSTLEVAPSEASRPRTNSNASPSQARPE